MARTNNIIHRLYKQFLVTITLAISTPCLAIGGELQEFVGISKGGKLTNIKYLSDPKSELEIQAIQKKY